MCQLCNIESELSKIHNIKAALNAMLTFYGMDESNGMSKVVHNKAREAINLCNEIIKMQKSNINKD